MKPHVFALALLCSAMVPTTARARIPALPAGARTHWVMGETAEIVTHVTFDPASVARELPRELRFITMRELADGRVGWAVEYLAAHPTHGARGVSFLEIVRSGRFTIDGRAPRWPGHGAIALWCARVAPSDSTADLGPGRPLLMLGLWIPDRAYVAYMRSKGHPATYGDVRLVEDPPGRWRGSVRAPGLDIVADCVPTGAVSGGASSAGTQALFPPRSSGIARVVRVAFAGHRVRDCAPASTWSIAGGHALAGGTVLQPSSFEYGYDLVGGAYPAVAPPVPADRR